MSKVDREYLQALVPDSLPEWKKIYDEAYAYGQSLPAGLSRFNQERGLSQMAYKAAQRRKGQLSWKCIMGLASVDDQVRGLEYLHDFMKRSGCSIDACMIIPSILTALPRQMRKDVAMTTSFVLDRPEDWERLAQAAPISPCFCDYHIACPNAVYNAEQCIRSGGEYTGVFSQVIWNYPGFNDETAHVVEVLKSVAMIAAKKDRDFCIDTYLDDGLPSYFLDICSYFGYALFERYILEELCGARYVVSFGQLLDKMIPKMALWLACAREMGGDGHPAVSYVYSNCIDHWDHDLEANYGFLISEVLMAAVVEKKFKTGASFLPIPITEKVHVPTAQAIANIVGAAQRAAATAEQWEGLMDFGPIERTRDVIIDKGRRFYDNLMRGLGQAGLDLADPLAMIFVLRNINPTRLEQMFHPSTHDEGQAEVKPFVPTSIGQRTIEEAEAIVAGLCGDPSRATNLAGRRVLLISADAHWYGAYAVSIVLQKLGAEVVNGGVSIEPVDALDLADEEGIEDLMISLHNGQALDYSRQLAELAARRNRQYRFFAGGLLNGILEGQAEPVDVSQLVAETGVRPVKSIEELVRALDQSPVR